MSTLGEIYALLSNTKVSGGKYQYVPTPYDVSSILVWPSSKILLNPKSDIFSSPLWKMMFYGLRS